MNRRGPRRSLLDRVVRPAISFRRRSLSAFHVFGYSGLALAVLLAMGLVVQQGRSWLVMGAIVLVAVATFLGLAMATKVVAGSETLVYYHHEIAVVATTSLLLWVIGKPLLPYLDATILGVGAFLACGRVGCLMVGCCHGRPARWGVRYREEHAAAGFPRHFVGVRLLPIQAAESLWVFVVVVVGSVVVLSGSEPGTAFAWYVVAYDVGRFGFEFVRGDAARPYHLGFSSAQWLSVALTWLVVAAGIGDLLPFAAWHLAAAVGLTTVLAVVAADRRWRRRDLHRIWHPRHVAEVAAVVAEAPPGIGVRSTSLGIQISVEQIEAAGQGVVLYSLSGRVERMGAEAAAAVAEMIMLLRHPDAPSEVVRGNNGVFHLLVRAV